MRWGRIAINAGRRVGAFVDSVWSSRRNELMIAHRVKTYVAGLDREWLADSRWAAVRRFASACRDSGGLNLMYTLL